MILIFQGDWGEDFYIIIQGSVYILLKKQDAVVVPEDKQQTEPKEEENKILITGNQANHARKHVACKHFLSSRLRLNSKNTCAQVRER